MRRHFIVLAGLSFFSAAAATQDATGHIFMAGNTFSQPNVCCGPPFGTSGEMAITKYAPGQTWDGGACVTTIQEGDTPMGEVHAGREFALCFERAWRSKWGS